MRYYRVWIYACNVALFASALVFAATALWTLTDARMALFPSVQVRPKITVCKTIAKFDENLRIFIFTALPAHLSLRLLRATHPSGSPSGNY